MCSPDESAAPPFRIPGTILTIGNLDPQAQLLAVLSTGRTTSAQIYVAHKGLRSLKASFGRDLPSPSLGALAIKVRVFQAAVLYDKFILKILPGRAENILTFPPPFHPTSQVPEPSELPQYLLMDPLRPACPPPPYQVSDLNSLTATPSSDTDPSSPPKQSQMSLSYVISSDSLSTGILTQGSLESRVFFCSHLRPAKVSFLAIQEGRPLSQIKRHYRSGASVNLMVPRVT